MTQKEIAGAFSNGKFDLVYPYLAENIKWNVVGEEQFAGRDEVIKKCEQTAEYFKSVTTDFKTINFITDGNRIAVNGTAEFIKDGNRSAFVYSCDVFEFSNENMLERITSYCIQENK
jgi:Zn/Cd-binding protein ZinT